MLLKMDNTVGWQNWSMLFANCRITETLTTNSIFENK